MNKSLKFLTIGLALAVLLVSQVGINRTAEALPVSSELSNDKVVFAGDLDDPATRTEQKDFYKPGDTVNFYLQDPDLRELAVNSRTTVTFTLASGDTWNENQAVSLAGTDPNDDPDLGYDRVPTGGSTDTDSTNGGVGTSTRYVNYAPGGDPGATPLVGRPDITVRNSSQPSQDGSPFVLTYNPELGTLSFPANVSGQSAEEDDLNTPDVDESHASTTIEIAFEYDVADVFTADQGAASDAPRTVNRAKVTSSSDGIGAWVTITEIVAIGDTDKDPRSDKYHGSIGLTGNSREASQSRDDADEANDKVWVRDGDTLTVTYYDSDHTTIIDTDTATIDAEDPSISGISPSGGTVTKDSSPVVSFMVTDDGSGFNTSRPRDHVELFVVDPAGGTTECRINDDLLTATRLSASEVEILFRNTENGGGWITGGGLNCVDDTGAFVRREIVDSKTPSDNNDGIQFEIRIEAVDRAGNAANDGKGATVKVTIDTRTPAFDDNNVLTGKNWDAAKKKETTDRAAIKVAFTEALQADSVDASDFTVEDPDVSVESAVLGGVNVEDGTMEEQQLNEIVYLTLSEELPSDSRPRVELDGSVLDKAGNELKKDSVARVEDGVSPGVTVDTFAAQLLADKGESAVTFSADENLAANAATLDNECTCLAITGPVDDGIEKGNVALPTPSSATYTFKARSGVTGIYGFMVQASDSRANLTQEGAEAVNNEKVTDFTVDGTAVTFKLKKWPLAAPVGDNGFTGDMKAAVKVRKNSETAKPLADDPTSTTTAEVTSIDPAAGTVTMTLSDADGDAAVKAATDEESGDTLYVSYSYVAAEQTIEVDVEEPVVEEFSPSGDTQDSRPFIRIKWDETEYAGDTHTTVTVMSATLTDPDGNEMVLVDDEMNLLSSSDQKLYSYLPESDLALGEYTITAVGRDAAGNVSETQSGKFKVVARPPVSIPLNLGWNLISLPAEAADSAIDAVINVDEVSQVLTYDPTVEGGWLAAVRINGSFEGGLTSIEASKAYLVYTTSVDPLKVDIPGLAQGTQEFPPTIQLHAGWNMVPASSLDPAFPKRDVDSYLSGVKWSRGYYYDTNGRLTGFIPGEEEDELVEKGRGFLIYVTEDSTLVP